MSDNNIDYDRLDQKSQVATKPSKAGGYAALFIGGLAAAGALYYVNFASQAPANKKATNADETFKVSKGTTDNFNTPIKTQPKNSAANETIKLDVPKPIEAAQATDVNSTVAQGEDLAAKRAAEEAERQRLAAEREFELKKLALANEAEKNRLEADRLAREAADKAARDAEEAKRQAELRAQREAEAKARREAAQKEFDARMNADAIIFDGKTDKKDAQQQQALVAPLPPMDAKGQIIRVPGQTGNKNLDFLAQSEQAQPEAVKATRIERPDAILPQGTIIRGFLETAINSDMPAMARAVVREDVYSMDGRRILIPKGSRLIGDYTVDVKPGQSRVFVIWQRILRADGLSMLVVSPGSDYLGRGGMPGYVDTHFIERFSSALLLSAIQIGVNYAGNVTTTTTTTINPITGLPQTVDTTTANSGSDLGNQAAVTGGKTINSFAQKELEKIQGIGPTITVDQGTEIVITLRRDVDLSAYYADPLQAELNRIYSAQTSGK